MKGRTLICSIVCVAILFAYSAEHSRVRATSRINVQVTNDSAFSNTYQLFDNVCNQAMSPIGLSAHGKTTLSICSNEALSDGYGSFKSKKSDSNAWNNFDQIRDGETRSLN